MVRHKFDDMKEFRAAIGKAIASLPAAAVSRVQRIALLSAYQSISSRSPVDKGVFRANNQVTTNLVASKPSSKKDPSGVVSALNANRKIGALKPYALVYISNPLPYAPPIEFGLFPRPKGKGGLVTPHGFSKKAPAGVYRITFREMVNRLPRIVQKEAARLTFARSGQPLPSANITRSLDDV